MGGKNFFILIIMLMYVMYIPIKIEQQGIDKSNHISKRYDEMIVNATSDATRQLLVGTDSYSYETFADGNSIDSRSINLNLDLALDRFYKTLYINLNIEDKYAEQQAIKHRLPIKIVTGYDGYYISYFKEDGQGEQWSDINPYSLVEGDLVIHFTLDDVVYVTDSKTNITEIGERREFAEKYPNSCLKSEKTFNEVKLQVINSSIQENLQYYTKHSNAIAEKHGWSLNFDIPYWGDRAIDSVSFIAFYQGQEFYGSERTLNSYGFSASKTVENQVIYGYIKEGRKLYAPYKDESVEGLTAFENVYEAAMNGYSPDTMYYYK